MGTDGAGNDALSARQIQTIPKFTREQPERGSHWQALPGVQVGPHEDKGPGQPFTQSRQRFILATGHGDGAGHYALSARQIQVHTMMPSAGQCPADWAAGR